MPIRPSSNSTMDIRHPPYMLPPDYRIYQMNKRLQERTTCDIQWWDAFVTEFFEDTATFTLQFVLDGVPKHFTVGRTLIPRFFRTMFDSGVVEMYMELKTPKDYHNSSKNCITLDCEHASMNMHHTQPVPTKVCAEGRFVADFTGDEFMPRMRSWNFMIRNHLEYIPKQVSMQHSAVAEDLCKNTTRAGLTSAMLNYLKMCIVLEPMKQLMSRQKSYNMDPRDCLRNCLYNQWQKMVHPTTDPARPTKRPSRKRKNSTNTNSSSATQNQKKKSISTTDVMMVGEPILMGSEFGEEDERMIQRLENNQFDNNPMQVKSEEREVTSASFPCISSPSTTQWQHPNTPISTTMQSNAMITPKNEPLEQQQATPTPPLPTST